MTLTQPVQITYPHAMIVRLEWELGQLLRRTSQMKVHWNTTLSVGASLLLVMALSAQDSAQNSEFEKPVRLKAGGQLIDTGTDIGHAGPIFTDHDGDGLPDLLVSSFRGNIRFFKNVGTRSQSKFKEQDPLKAGGAPIRVHNW